MRRNLKSPLLAALLSLAMLGALGPPQARAQFQLGDAANYAVLYEGNGGNTLQINNVTTNTTGGEKNDGAAGQGGGIGNIGVGGTGLVHLNGPGTVNGNIDFAATLATPNQVSGSNISITGSTNYGVSAVTSALNTVNALNTTLGALPGTNVSVNGNTTINASAGTFSASGTGYANASVFNVTSFSLNNGQTLTINGDGTHVVVLNFTSGVNFHGNVALTGGLTPDEVLFNFYGSGLTLDLNNGGGSPASPQYLSQGIFLDPNGPINVTDSNVLGRVFGGDSHDFQFNSGSNITAPSVQATPVPPGLVLGGVGALCFLLPAAWRRRKLLSVPA